MKSTVLGLLIVVFTGNFISISAQCSDAGVCSAGSKNDNLIKLKPGDDLLVRTSYNILLDKFTITPQLLFIKRLNKSNIVNLLAMGPPESYIDIENSEHT